MAKHIALFVLVMCALGSQAIAADVPSWRVIPEKSKIGFSATYAGAEVTGEFPSYTADIKFDPKQLEKSKVLVRIELSKVKSSDKDAEQSLPDSDWFDAKEHPIATFESTKIYQGAFLKNPEGYQYMAEGNLTIRGKTTKLVFPFRVDMFKGDGADAGKSFARMKGAAMLKRLDFAVGQGQWADVSTVKNEIAVQIKLEAVSP